MSIQGIPILRTPPPRGVIECWRKMENADIRKELTAGRTVTLNVRDKQGTYGTVSGTVKSVDNLGDGLQIVFQDNVRQLLTSAHDLLGPRKINYIDPERSSVREQEYILPNNAIAVNTGGNDDVSITAIRPVQLFI